MQFLILRGHTRLVPQGGLAEFPDAILNAKRLDLYNLYREVTSFMCQVKKKKKKLFSKQVLSSSFQKGVSRF